MEDKKIYSIYRMADDRLIRTITCHGARVNEHGVVYFYNWQRHNDVWVIGNEITQAVFHIKNIYYMIS